MKSLLQSLEKIWRYEDASYKELPMIEQEDPLSENEVIIRDFLENYINSRVKLAIDKHIDYLHDKDFT